MSSSVPTEFKEFVRRYWPFSDQEMSDDWHALSGDAGFRRYFRAGGTATVIAANSPPTKEQNLAYVKISRLLAELGVRVPTIFAVDFGQGYFVLEDLGDGLLQDQLSRNDTQSVYTKAMEQLGLIQSCAAQPDFIPAYDRQMLVDEMALFVTWFAEKLLGATIDQHRKARIQDLFEFLAEQALQQPKTLVHRDFHARNLMTLQNGELAVIDFQDAVWGPITYDLASLGRDCYVRWSRDRLDTFVEQSADQLLSAGQINTAQRAEFRQWFDLMGLQRHIKVLGIFSRLSLRDGKHRYLRDLPLVLRYTLEVMEQYDACKEMADWMTDELIPVCVDQDWYSDWQTAGSESELA